MFFRPSVYNPPFSDAETNDHKKKDHQLHIQHIFYYHLR